MFLSRLLSAINVEVWQGFFFYSYSFILILGLYLQHECQMCAFYSMSVCSNSTFILSVIISIQTNLQYRWCYFFLLFLKTLFYYFSCYFSVVKLFVYSSFIAAWPSLTSETIILRLPFWWFLSRTRPATTSDGTTSKSRKNSVNSLATSVKEFWNILNSTLFKVERQHGYFPIFAKPELVTCI